MPDTAIREASHKNLVHLFLEEGMHTSETHVRCTCLGLTELDTCIKSVPAFEVDHAPILIYLRILNDLMNAL